MVPNFSHTLTKVSISLLFVHLGVAPCPWLLPNARATAKRFDLPVLVASDNSEILRMADRTGLAAISVATDELRISVDREAFLNPAFRRGFWFETARRLYVIDYVQSHKEIGPLLHLESDVLLMPSLNVEDFLQQPFDLMFGIASSVLGSGAIVFSRCSDAAANLSQGLNQAFLQHQTREEMSALFHLMQTHPKGFGELPTASNPDSSVFGDGFSTARKRSASVQASGFGGFFDVGPVGQFLLGTDPRNSHGWSQYGQDSVFSDFRPSQMLFRVESGQLIAESRDRGWEPNNRILSLHVHSKDVKILACADPLPKLSSAIRRLNEGQYRRFKPRAFLASVGVG